MANYANCPSIDNILLDQQSKIALEDVARKLKYGKVLQKALLGGTLFNALVHDRAITQAFSVHGTDWKALAETFNAVESFTKNRIELIAFDEAMRTNGKQKQLWTAIYNLCMFN